MSRPAQQRVLRRGVIVAAKYRIDQAIVRGGWSVIYRATHIEMERPVAIKVLSIQDDIRPSWLERFTREARLASQLTHPNTVTIFDYGQDPQGFLYLVMEWVEGRSLHQYITQKGPLSPFRVAQITAQILESLQEAHQRRFLHRDLKPSNIMLTRDYQGRDTIKVLDFGIAKDLSEKPESDARITHRGSFVGTPRYASPEQLEEKQQLTPASDIYSLGLLMWEALVGDPAVPTTNYGECIHLHTSPDPWRLPPAIQCPPGLERILYRALAKPVAGRYQDCASMLTDLHAWLRSNEATGAVDADLLHIKGLSGDQLLKNTAQPAPTSPPPLRPGPPRTPDFQKPIPSLPAKPLTKPSRPASNPDHSSENRLPTAARLPKPSISPSPPDAATPSASTSPNDAFSTPSPPPVDSPTASAPIARATNPIAPPISAGPDETTTPKPSKSFTPSRTQLLMVCGAVLLIIALTMLVFSPSTPQPAPHADTSTAADEIPAADLPTAGQDPLAAQTSSSRTDQAVLPSHKPHSTEKTYSAELIWTSLHESGWQRVGKTGRLEVEGITQENARLRKRGRTIAMTIFITTNTIDAEEYADIAQPPARAIRFGQNVVHISPGTTNASSDGVQDAMEILDRLKNIADETSDKTQ